MDINLPTDVLRTFVAIADSGSFTQAAEQVYRTQSAVSQQVQRLEQSVGKSLFVREGRTTRLTNDGESLLGYARRILKLHDEAVSTFFQPDIEGTVSFGLADDYVTSFLAPILSRFASSHPRVQMEIRCEPSKQLVPLVERGKLDVALISCMPGMPQAQIVRQEQGVWAASEAYLIPEDEPIPLALFEPG